METIEITVSVTFQVDAVYLEEDNDLGLHARINNALIGESVKVKTGVLENLVMGTINSIIDITPMS